MKRTSILVVGALVLALLMVRMVFVLIGREKSDKREFVSKLNYDLSAHVDSVGLFNKSAPVGFLYITLTRGELNYNEKKIARSLKRGKDLRFLVPFKGNRFEFFSRDAVDYKAGDSLLINSSDDKLVVFRSSQKVHEYAISGSLRGED